MARPVRTAAEAIGEVPAAPLAPSNPSVGPEGEALVLMLRGSEDIYVHPTCVKAHQKQGWKAI